MSSSVGFQLWHSPIPYIFGGLIVAMGLMVTALVVLACSHCKSAEGNDNSISQVEAPAAVVPLEREPTLMVVIMAGDDKPSFLAKPFDATIVQRGRCSHRGTCAQPVSTTRGRVLLMIMREILKVDASFFLPFQFLFRHKCKSLRKSVDVSFCVLFLFIFVCI